MLSLFLASLLFFAIHALISGTALRGLIIVKIGQGPYIGLFAALSAGALFWVILAYSEAPHVELWADVAALKMLALPLMAVAVVLAVLAFSTPNPTAAGGEKALAGEQSARGIIKVTRHPFLVAVTIWSALQPPMPGTRFRRSRSVGAYFGLTPRRTASGELDWSGRISKWAIPWCGATCSRPPACGAPEWRSGASSKPGA